MGVRKMTNQMDWLGFGSSCTAVGTAHSVEVVLKQVEERHRTLILIKTKEGAVVGGLGGAMWYKAAKFSGSGTAVGIPASSRSTPSRECTTALDSTTHFS